MEITTNIIRALIKEEMEKSLLQEMRQEETDAIAAIAAILTRLDAEKMNAEAVMSDAEAQYRASKAAAESPANRSEISEMGCNSPETNISMGVDHHSEDQEGNMAKRQMYKTAEYATAIFDMIEDNEEFPAWIQSKMTKIADYIGAVKHYLEYDHVMGEAKLTKKQIKGRDDDAKSIMKSTEKQYGKEEGESAAYAIATNIQKEKSKNK
jgi:hypothetical protein